MKETFIRKTKHLHLLHQVTRFNKVYQKFHHPHELRNDHQNENQMLNMFADSHKELL